MGQLSANLRFAVRSLRKSPLLPAALAAVTLPARRAARLDLALALRGE